MRFRGDNWIPKDKARREALYRQAMLYRESQFQKAPVEAMKAMARVSGHRLALLPVKAWMGVGFFTRYLAGPLGAEHVVKWSPESGIEVVMASDIADELQGMRWPTE